MSELEQQIDELYSLYQGIKNEIRHLDKYLYERWKAGGYIIDEDIMSMYPNLSQCCEKLKDKGLIADPSKEDDYEDNYEDLDDGKSYRRELLGESDLGTNYWE